ncbi:MAG: hypothetical protein K9N06_12510 [Candidatus Cloacimonetes bacterium]|nr:hypothetical protein [Candidatus Cloacimonadota bacterium]
MQEIIRQIRDAIKDTEFAGKTYIAGGFVRDQVMGLQTNDLDITVELSEGGIRLAQYLHNLGIATKPVLYQEFGTALVLIGNYRIEFVMTRNERYRKGSRKPVTNSGTIREDIYRRDFTINSLIMDIMTGEILDLSGYGLSDIKHGIIRATSAPGIIFCDDPLRILRAIRFANLFQYVIEENTRKGILKNRGELTQISGERKRDEFEKILLSKTAQNGLKMLFKFGLMEFLIPELLSVENKICFKALDSLPPLFEPRLAILLTALNPDENKKGIILKICGRLKLSNKISSFCLLLHKLMDILNELVESDYSDDIELRIYYYQHQSQFQELFSYLEIYFSASGKKTDFGIIKKHAQRIALVLGGKNYPVSGAVLKEYFSLPACREVGKYIDLGFEIWLRDPELKAEEILPLIGRKSPI